MPARRTGPRDLHGPLLGQQQPAQAGTIGLVRGHFAAPGADAAWARLAGAGQFHHQVGAEGGEAAPLLRGEGLPALLPHHSGIGTQHGAIWKAADSGAVKHQPASLPIRPEEQPHREAGVAPAGLAARGSQDQQVAIGGQLEHSLGIVLALSRWRVRGLA